MSSFVVEFPLMVPLNNQRRLIVRFGQKSWPDIYTPPPENTKGLIKHTRTPQRWVVLLRPSGRSYYVCGVKLRPRPDRPTDQTVDTNVSTQYVRLHRLGGQPAELGSENVGIDVTK